MYISSKDLRTSLLCICAGICATKGSLTHLQGFSLKKKAYEWHVWRCYGSGLSLQMERKWPA